MRAIATLGLRLALAASLTTCAGPAKERPATGLNAVSALEFQQAVERLSGGLIDRLVDAAQPLAESDSDLRAHALRFMLTNGAAALDIATGPIPALNLLDMAAFASLSRWSLEQHQIPDTFGERGRPLAEAFRESETEAWDTLSGMAGPSVAQKLQALVRDWEQANPDQVRVESVRLLDLSHVAGVVSEQRAAEAQGLLAAVKSMSQSADQAVLLGERGVFLVHRLPFLWRLQARMGVIDVVSDGVSQLGRASALIEQTQQLGPIARDLMSTMSNVASAAHDGRAMLATMDQWRSRDGAGFGVPDVLHSANRLADKGLQLLDAGGEFAPSGRRDVLAAVVERVDGLARRVLLYLVLLGAAWSLFFWGGLFLVRRFAPAPPRPAPRATEPRHDETHPAN